MVKRRIKRILTSSQRRKKIQRRRVINISLVLFLLIIFFVGLVYLIRLPYFRIKNIEINGTSDQKKEEITSFIRNTIDGNKYFFVPKSELIFYSTMEAEKNIQDHFVSIQKIHVRKKYPSNLIINVIDRSPVGIYCNNKCYFLDSDGYIYAPASSFSSGVYMVFMDHTRNESNSPLNTYLTEPKTFPILQNYLKDLQTLGLTPEKVTFINPREIQIDNTKNGYIFISLDHPYDESIQNIKTVFLQGITKFEYIDVRYGNKIFYKI